MCSRERSDNVLPTKKENPVDKVPAAAYPPATFLTVALRRHDFLCNVGVLMQLCIRIFPVGPTSVAVTEAPSCSFSRREVKSLLRIDPTHLPLPLPT